MQKSWARGLLRMPVFFQTNFYFDFDLAKTTIFAHFLNKIQIFVHDLLRTYTFFQGKSEATYPIEQFIGNSKIEYRATLVIDNHFYV